MKLIKRYAFLLFFVFLSFTTAHKFYVSITQIDFIQEQKVIQVTTRIFVDDFEKLLRNRYDASITLNVTEDENKIDAYIDKYLAKKLKISINGDIQYFKYLGKEYDNDIMYCYLEIENIERIDSIEVKNQILFDEFEEQENIIKTKINGEHKSFILTAQKDYRSFTYE